MDAATIQETTRYLQDTTRTLAQAREALEGQIALVRDLRQENAALRQEIEDLRTQVPPLVGHGPESPRPEPPRGPRRRASP